MSLQRRKSVIIINSFRFNIFFSYWSFFDSLYDKRTFSNEESHELQSILRMNMITKNNPKSCSTFLKCLPSIHSKSEKVCGFYFSVSKKSAEKVRKSQRHNFATNVRKSMKSLRNTSFENKMS